MSAKLQVQLQLNEALASWLPGALPPRNPRLCTRMGGRAHRVVEAVVGDYLPLSQATTGTATAGTTGTPLDRAGRQDGDASARTTCSTRDDVGCLTMHAQLQLAAPSCVLVRGRGGLTVLWIFFFFLLWRLLLGPGC